MMGSDARLNTYQVVCVCGGHGYPRGTATAARITMIGRALRESGIPFRVLHCGPSPAPMNRERSGVYEGIPFQYTTTPRRPEAKWLHILVYLWAVFELTIRLTRLWPQRRATAIYLYLMDGPVVLYVGILCRILGLPLVQELCEWWPGDPRCNRFDHWLHRSPMFKLASGVLVISRAIEERVRERRSALSLDFPIQRVPALVDSEKFLSAPIPANGGNSAVPEFVYCGVWKKDHFFLIRALRIVRQSGYNCRLRLVLGIAEEMAPSLLAYASEQGVGPDDLILVGCVNHMVLSGVYRQAVGLLMPLWDDDRSITRLPNKMSEYLASGRPVVASEVGDLRYLLKDGVNAHVVKAGDEQAFAERMIDILADPSRNERIGLAGQRLCVAELDFRKHGTELSRLFSSSIQNKQKTGMTGKMLENRPLRLVRNVVCGSFAAIILALGRARRAKRKAFDDDVVTSIYFHKPNKRLFTKCVRWLKRNGYQFIDTAEMIEIVHGRRKAPRGAVWLTFDDGCKELKHDVLPVARQEKIPVTLFIPSGIIEGNGLFPWMHSGDVSTPAGDAVRHSMTLEEVKTAASYPEVTIGSHTVSHPITTEVQMAVLRYELEESKRQLEHWIGAPVKSFAYPGGYYNGRESRVLAEYGYELAATTEPRFVTPSANSLEIPRFHVGDNIPFSEAICNMVGVWHPAFDPMVHIFGRARTSFTQSWRAVRTQTAGKHAKVRPSRTSSNP